MRARGWPGDHTAGVVPAALFDTPMGYIMGGMNSTFRRVRSVLSDLVAEDRPSFKRLDASSARYDDGSWLTPRR